MVRTRESGPQLHFSREKAIAFPPRFGFLHLCPARRLAANRLSNEQVFQCSVDASLVEASQGSGWPRLVSTVARVQHSDRHDVRKRQPCLRKRPFLYARRALLL